MVQIFSSLHIYETKLLYSGAYNDRVFRAGACSLAFKQTRQSQVRLIPEDYTPNLRTRDHVCYTFQIDKEK